MKKKGSVSTHRDCANCGAPEGSIPGIKKHNACSRCEITFYCSTKCQKQHWKTGGHKKHCVAKADRTAAAAKAAAAEEGGSGGEDGMTTSGAPATTTTTTDSASDECAVCLERLSAKQVVVLPCSHRFHASCVDELRKAGVQQLCPLCRAALPASPEKLFDQATERFVALRRRVARGGRTFATLLKKEKKEVAEVLKVLHEAWEQGCAVAAWAIGLKHANGQGVPRDLKKAADWYSRGASRDCVKAQNSLGNFYLEGCKGAGIAMNSRTAAQWYRTASDLGHEGASYNLARMYADGKGVKQSNKEAVRLLRKASAADHAVATHMLADALRNGKIGMRVDHKAAFPLYKKASDLGDETTLFHLGSIYREGRGVRGDMKLAVAFWEAAVSSGRNAKADGYDQYSNRDERVKNAGLAAVALAVTFNEGRPPHFPHDATKSTHWWEVAGGEFNDSKSMFNLGVSYLQGNGVPFNEGKAAKWVKMAIDGGVDSGGHAEKVYGMMCHLGQGVPQSDGIAKHYLRRGAAKGSEACAEYIRQMENGTIGTDRIRPTCKDGPMPTSPAPGSFEAEHGGGGVQGEATRTVGARVELRNLKSKPELNGKRGVVAGYDHSSGLSTVRLDDAAALGGPFKLKRANLVGCPPSPGATAGAAAGASSFG